jgi:heme-degrading monooxygenase HmoA
VNLKENSGEHHRDRYVDTPADDRHRPAEYLREHILRDRDGIGKERMIVVSNRVCVPEDRVETFVERLSTDHGIEDEPGFRGMKLLSPVDADRFVTMTLWDSLEDYESWREGTAFERAHAERSSEDAFAAPNEVEIHEVTVERTPADRD